MPACTQFSPWQQQLRLCWHCVVQARRGLFWQQVLLDGGMPTPRRLLRVLGSFTRMLLGAFSLHLVCTIGLVHCLGSRRFSL